MFMPRVLILGPQIFLEGEVNLLDVFEFILPGIYWNSLIYKLIFFMKFGGFWAISANIISVFFSFSRDFHYVNVGVLCGVPQVSEPMLLLHSFIFFCFSDWITSIFNNFFHVNRLLIPPALECYWALLVNF